MSKLVKSLREAIVLSGLRDGMTVSFHHHLRNGDYVLNMVMAQIAELEKICFSDPWSEKSIASEVDNRLSYWLVAEVDGVVVGYVGSQTVLDAADMDVHLQDADLILTGEGRVDGQTVRGKVIAGVLRRAKGSHVPVYVFGGAVEREAMTLYESGASAIFSVSERPSSVEDAMEQAQTWLFDTVYAAMRAYGDGYFSVARRVFREKLMEAESVLTGDFDESDDV